MRNVVTFLVLAACAQLALVARAAEKKEQVEKAPLIAADAVTVRMGEPVLVDQAPPTLRQWGPYQTPDMWRLPSGDICLAFSRGRDHYADHGVPCALFVSCDEGRTWRAAAWETLPIPGRARPIFHGEYFGLVAGAGLKLDFARLPKPVGHFDGYAGFEIRRLADCPPDVIRWFDDIQALRWSPQTKVAAKEHVRWDHRGQLLWSYNDKPQGIPGDWSQRIHYLQTIVRRGKELLCANDWTQYETFQGKIPGGFECSLMVSTDNAHSWARRSTIVTVPAGEGSGEPMIELNRAGELIAVLRRDFGTEKPMYLVFSKDGGYTWSRPQALFDFGVEPQLLQLDNGVMVLTFGRPGVWMSFSLDGGHSWTQPRAIVAGDHKDNLKHSGAYTNLLPLGKDTFLMTYDEFLRPNAKGQPCKSILVRRISAKPKG